jgi:CubicO group peptidase (beta-lactamase class C family)
MSPSEAHQRGSSSRRLRALATAVVPTAAGDEPDGGPGPDALPTYRNPSLVVHDVPGTQGGQGSGSTLGGWMMPDVRRAHFRMPQFGHQNINMRATNVLELTAAPDERIAALEKVAAATTHECFCGMVVLRGSEIVFESYHEDFDGDTAHSMQSITKSTVNLIVGKLVEEGKLSLDARVKDIIPECGSGYADATLQNVMDMSVKNMFLEGYADDYNDASVATGYSRQEIGLGWRLPPLGEERRIGMREFVAAIEAPKTEEAGTSGYKSPNNDLMAWVAEKVSGKSIAAHLQVRLDSIRSALPDSRCLFSLASTYHICMHRARTHSPTSPNINTAVCTQDIVEAAGLEGSMHCACDVDWVPILSGGGFMTTRDLARYGQLFCRRGAGVDGSVVGSGAFLDETRNPPLSMQDVFEGGAVKVAGWYHNQMQSNGKYVGHGGFGGQWLAADEASGCSVSFYSVFNANGGVDVNTQEMSEEIFQLFR